MKTCPICGKEFEPTFHAQKYCSIGCKQTPRNKYKREYMAKYMVEYRTKKRLYTETHKEPLEIKQENNRCPVCGKEFEPTWPRHRQKYCSTDCKAVITKLNYKKNYPKLKEYERKWRANNRDKLKEKNKREYEKLREYYREIYLVKKTCIICGKEFQQTRMGQKCCGNACQLEKSKRDRKEWHAQNPEYMKQYNKNLNDMRRGLRRRANELRKQKQEIEAK